jgi:hypothetical protein
VVGLANEPAISPHSRRIVPRSIPQLWHILISPKFDLVVVRLANTPPEKVSAVAHQCKELVDAFRPTA